MTIVEAPPGITGGVDTHLDTHVAAALDPLGRLVGTESFDADAAGYKALLSWLENFGQVDKIGVEGTGSYGVGLARFLRRKGVEVIEVNRPNRQARRNHGKSDPLDAVEAARAVLSGRALGEGKTKDGPVEAIRVLVVAKRSARQARVKAIVQMRHLVITAPDQLHSRLKGLTVTALVAESAELRATRVVRSGDGGHEGIALFPRPPNPCSRRRARRARTSRSSRSYSPPPPTCWPASASVPTPLRPSWWPPATTPNASIPRLPGPTCVGLPRSRLDSGKNAGHLRRHKGGNRQANSALWRIVMVRIAHDPETIHYFDRRVKEGRTKRDVIRILQRYIAREVYRYLPRG